jgi:hypothetical protein
MKTLSAPRRSAFPALVATLALSIAMVSGYRAALETTAGAVYGVLQVAPASSGAALLAAAEHAFSTQN